MIWKRSEIRAARQTPLKPVCEALGYRLEHIRDGNYRILQLPNEIILKDHYWVCTDDGSAGNAIDFLVKIQGKTFSQAMQLLRS
jgi:hypothetical protein